MAGPITTRKRRAIAIPVSFGAENDVKPNASPLTHTPSDIQVSDQRSSAEPTSSRHQTKAMSTRPLNIAIRPTTPGWSQSTSETAPDAATAVTARRWMGWRQSRLG